MKKFILAQLIACLVFFFSPSLANAQLFELYEWRINEFDADITIQKDGVVSVTENITTDFNKEKHGIFRNIPYIYRLDDKRYYTKISIEEILRNGEKEEYQVSHEGNDISIRIGDEDVTHTGEVEHTITYKVVGALQGYEKHDELYWNVTGNYWDVPIGSSTATVTIDEEKLSNAECFVGPSGSNEKCSAIATGDRYSFSARTLQAGEGMTIVVSYPKGAVLLTTVEQPKTFFEQIASPQFLVSFLLTLTMGITLIIWNWTRRGRDFVFLGKYLFDPNAKKILRPIGHDDTVVVEYTPPEKLKPAEMGVLVDERADTLDITSSIVDLAAKGHLTIKEIPKKWTFGKTDYELSRTKKKENNLEQYEKILLSGLFESGNIVKVSTLKTKFYDDLKKVKDQLYKDVVKKNYFPHNPENVKNIYLAIFMVVAIAGAALFIFNQTQLYPNAILTGITGALIPVGLIGLIFSRSMSRRTAEGAELFRRLKGYRLFLENVEKHKQKFAEDKNLFNDILPYAIVFGLTEKIAKAMKDMEVTPSAPTWYSGTRAFNASLFANNVNNFSSSVSKSISSAPKSSGFSGGSSGGGFGGGGGGSW